MQVHHAGSCCTNAHCLHMSKLSKKCLSKLYRGLFWTLWMERTHIGWTVKSINVAKTEIHIRNLRAIPNVRCVMDTTHELALFWPLGAVRGLSNRWFRELVALLLGRFSRWSAQATRSLQDVKAEGLEIIDIDSTILESLFSIWSLRPPYSLSKPT